MPPKFDDESRPKFHFIFEKIEGGRILTKPIADYENAKLSTGEEVEVEIKDTPVSEVTQKAGAIFTIAEDVSADYDQVSVIRPAEICDPHDVDLDGYHVWINIRGHPNFGDMLNKASTNVDQDLSDYIDTRAFWVKQEPTSDHHMKNAQLSTRFKVVLKFQGTTSST